MIRTVLLLIALFYFQSGFSQSTIEPNPNPFEYKWLNNKFPIDTLISYDNDTLIFSQKQKYYVINFWFTSCPPCIAEIKWLNKLKDEYESSELEFLAISYETKENLNRFLKVHKFEFQQFFLEENLINANYLTIGYPTTIILDKNGEVIFQKSGGHANQEDAVEIYKLISLEIEKLSHKKK